jgi:hypothetical protein
VTRIPLKDLILLLAPIVRPVMLRYYVPTCCIATCCVLQRVFAHFGYRADPLPVAAMAFNERMLKALERNEVPPQARRLGAFTVQPEGMIDRQRWFDLTGAWGVGIVPESAQVSEANGYEGFGGHLLLQVRETLVDASIAQASRPEKDIFIPMMVAMPATPEFLRGQPLVVPLDRGALRYQRINDLTFRSAPDWQRRDQMLQPLNEILQRVVELQAVKEHL